MKKAAAYHRVSRRSVIHRENFRVKRLAMKQPGTKVEICLRHATGKLEFCLTSPVSIDVVYTPKPKQRAVEPHPVS